jgi:MYXO-CTERM domain-containing protein
MRLLADGAGDPAYGRAGASTIELKSARGSFPTINDMQALGDDTLVLGGGDYFGAKFVARLLGDSAGGSPGVLSMAQDRVIATEQSGQAVLKVRRSGGSAGAVAVTYVSRDFAESAYVPGARASSGTDYTAFTGRLTWPDGDVSEREIVVPIVADATEEVPEFFEVVLESPEGGAGLGAVGADVEIAGASYPVGDLRIERTTPSVFEAETAVFFVYRDFYAQGAVSVTVRVAASSTATPGQDFQWQDVVLTWGDGDAVPKAIEVQTLKDKSRDSNEVLQLELVSPTGGASLSGSLLASTVINDPPKPPSRSSGGGSFGWLGAMLLGLAGFLRRRLTGQR